MCVRFLKIDYFFVLIFFKKGLGKVPPMSWVNLK